jgi:hypothetical protein
MAYSLLQTLSDLNSTRRAPPRLTMPGMQSTGYAPMQFGGRGYRDTDGGTIIPDGLDPAQQNNIRQAGQYRANLPQDLGAIATVSPNSDLPSIHGGDYARLRQARSLTMPSPDQLGRPQQTNPLAEKQAAESAMGRSVESTVANMRLSRGYPRTLEGMARMEDRNTRTATDQANRSASYDAKLQQIDRTGLNARSAIAAETAALQDRDLTQAGIAKGALQDQIIADQTRANLNLTIPGQTDPTALARATAEGVRMGLRENLNPNPAPTTFTMPATPGAPAAPAPSPAPQSLTATNPQMTAPVAPPDTHIARLRQRRNDPQVIADFETRYGKGAAAKYLN